MIFGEDDLAAYVREGTTIVRGISSLEECARLRRLFDEEVARRDEDGFVTDETRDGDVMFTRVPDMAQELAPIRESQLVARARPIAARILGVPEGQIHVAPSFLFKPPGSAQTDWHQHSVNTKPPELGEGVTFWMPLEPIGPAQGALRVVPGSHLGPVLETDDRLAIFDRLVDAAGVVVCEAGVGDAVLIHDNLIHGAAPNDGTGPRVAMTVYCLLRRS